MEMVVGVLGILKAGGAYVPLDQGLRRSGWRTCWKTIATLVVTEQDRRALLESVAHRSAGCLRTRWLARRSSVNPRRTDLGARLPGLCDLHLGLDRAAEGRDQRRQCGEAAHAGVVAARSCGCVDIVPFVCVGSVWEMYGALLHGGRLVIVSYATSRAPQEYRLLCEQAVTVLNQTPSAFQQLMVAQAQSGLRHAARPAARKRSAVPPRASTTERARGRTEPPRRDARVDAHDVAVLVEPDQVEREAHRERVHRAAARDVQRGRSGMRVELGEALHARGAASAPRRPQPAREVAAGQAVEARAGLSRCRTRSRHRRLHRRRRRRLGTRPLGAGGVYVGAGRRRAGRGRRCRRGAAAGARRAAARRRASEPAVGARLAGGGLRASRTARVSWPSTAARWSS